MYLLLVLLGEKVCHNYVCTIYHAYDIQHLELMFLCMWDHFHYCTVYTYLRKENI